MRTLYLLTAALFLAACGGASAKAPLAAGQSARVGDLVITYTGARILPPSTSVRPLAGMQFVAVTVTLQNHGRSATQVPLPVPFTVIDGKDQRWAQAFVSPATDDTPIDGVLPAGDTVSGGITFDVPTTATPYRLRYTAPGSTSTATWAISLP